MEQHTKTPKLSHQWKSICQEIFAFLIMKFGTTTKKTLNLIVFFFLLKFYAHSKCLSFQQISLLACFSFNSDGFFLLLSV